MSKHIVVSNDAPNPLPSVFPQAVVANGLVFCSGNIAMDPETCKVIDGDIKAHTHQILKNLSVILKAAGSGLEKIVKINVFITDFANFSQLNEVYTQYFQGSDLPCRTCVAVKALPFDTDIEIECIALL
ncbi:putative L-PSP endoribonuclease family protein Brt1 [Dactylonectria macrodidyma]|uniref:L-PSP endoribonuclease family protein Brt1 n=1 Tax=Dactylonectria macrodidyma TaxID=307937 RepID=A0A9P9FGX0_9HYPO|nr:putative L-PSP endoribonuclease family protein Brt1 [Dactylonectria macrodidyma]